MFQNGGQVRVKVPRRELLETGQPRLRQGNTAATGGIHSNHSPREIAVATLTGLPGKNGAVIVRSFHKSIHCLHYLLFVCLLE